MGSVERIAVLIGAFDAPEASDPTPATSFAWNAPPGCPAAREFAAVLSSQLPDGASSGPAGRADVRRAGDAWHADIVLVARDGSETSSALDARSCELLAEIVAIKLALAAAAQAAEPSPPPQAPRPPVLGALPASEPTTEQPPRASRRSDGTATRELTVRVLAGADFGWTPRTAPELAGGITGAGRRLRVGAGIRYAGLRLVDFVGGAASVQLVVATLDGCTQADLGPGQLRWCFGAEAGQLWARGATLARARTAREPFVSLTSGAWFAWPSAARVRLLLGFDAAWVVVRPGLHVDGHRDFWRAPTTQLRCWIGAEVAVTRWRSGGHSPSRGSSGGVR